jgi:hypothetical protein
VEVLRGVERSLDSEAALSEALRSPPVEPQNKEVAIDEQTN